MLGAEKDKRVTMKSLITVSSPGGLRLDSETGSDLVAASSGEIRKALPGVTFTLTSTWLEEVGAFQVMGSEDRQGVGLRRGEAPVRTGGEGRTQKAEGTHHRLQKVTRRSPKAGSLWLLMLQRGGPAEGGVSQRRLTWSGSQRDENPGCADQGRVALALAPQ